MEENMKLVYFIYNRHFKTYSYLKDDLISEGLLALCRTEKYFDETKNTKRSTYLGKAIYMAMLKYLKKEQKHINVASLDKIIDDCEDITFVETLQTPDLIDLYLTEQVISEVLNTKLNPKTKQVIELYLDDYKQLEIAEITGLSQPQVSRIIKRFRKIYVKENMEVIP